MTIYLDAGTTYTKIITINESLPNIETQKIVENDNITKRYYVLLSKNIKNLSLDIYKSCGHMSSAKHNENEIIALARGGKKYISEFDATILDLGSRDAKWVNFKDGKFHDMDWNTSCASSTGATVEMLLKFYDLKIEDLNFTKDKFNVTCGIFGLEKIMDSISKGEPSSVAVSKFIHGIAYNAWKFAKNPPKIYLSGGFCDNKCLVKSLEQYCQVVSLGRFVLCEGLIE